MNCPYYNFVGYKLVNKVNNVDVKELDTMICIRGKSKYSYQTNCIFLHEYME